MIFTPKAEEIKLGPVLPPDAQLLEAVCNLTDPKVVVEFGFFNGTSAKAMLNFMDEDSNMYSYDVVDRDTFKLTDDRHTLLVKNMCDFTPEDISNQMIDIVFFDASHEWNDSWITFNKIKPLLKPETIIIVHDTGAYDKSLFNPEQLNYIKKIKQEYVYHCPDEHKFLNKLHEEGYNCVNFFCTRKIRHGIAVLQKVFNLEDVLS